MKNKSEKQSVGRPEPEFKFDLGTVLFIIIGFIVSWGNMLIIYDYIKYNPNSQLKVLALLSIIFTTMIPGIIIAIKNRYWGYGYMFGFTIAGIPFSLFIDLFIGGYTFFTSLFLFLIMWLVFWRAWRSLGAIKSITE